MHVSIIFGKVESISIVSRCTMFSCWATGEKQDMYFFGIRNRMHIHDKFLEYLTTVFAVSYINK